MTSGSSDWASLTSLAVSDPSLPKMASTLTRSPTLIPAPTSVSGVMMTTLPSIVQATAAMASTRPVNSMFDPSPGSGVALSIWPISRATRSPPARIEAWTLTRSPSTGLPWISVSGMMAITLPATVAVPASRLSSVPWNSITGSAARTVSPAAAPSARTSPAGSAPARLQGTGPLQAPEPCHPMPFAASAYAPPENPLSICPISRARGRKDTLQAWKPSVRLSRAFPGLD